MTKTHQDLEAVLQLLQEKEKDLELAANIGQSLLERNKNLYKKTEALENYVNEVEERETQLKHVVTMKDKLLKTFIDEDLSDVEDYSPADSSAYDSCRDESMLSLQERCDQLEDNNASLILEALKIRQETDKEEEKEKELVYECIKELAEAKGQISHLTDEISLKAQDNIAQHEEISKLIDTVLELQERHNMLTEENEGLQETLKHSQENQDDLKGEVTTLHEKYQECYEMLMENQREMKMMKEKLSRQKSTGDEAAGTSRPDPRDSLAQEIEESVRRDIETSQEKKKHTDRVMQTVRVANTKRFPKAIKGGMRPVKAVKPGATKGAESKPFDFSFAAAPPDEQRRPAPSMDELRAAVRRLSVSDSNGAPQGRTRRAWAPEKLQIVKPMEGSATLHKWQSLAKPTMSGLHSVVPGVHVKGEIVTRKDKSRHETNQTSTRRNENDTKREETGTKNVEQDTKDKIVQSTSKNTSSKIVDKKTKKEAKLQENTQDKSIENSKKRNNQAITTTVTTTVTVTKPVQSNQVSSTVITSTNSNLTEIVKSKLSAEHVLSPKNETSTSILNTIFRSTVGISTGFSSSTPVTTTAKSSFVTMTTTTTSPSMSVGGFSRPRHVRSKSSENLLSLISPFNQNEESTNSTSKNIGIPPASNPQTGGIGLGGFVGRLVRSSSNENLADQSIKESGFSRSSSSGKLTDLLKNSDIAKNIGKASSMDTMTKSSGVDMQNKRASFQLGDSPPSASHLEMMGDLGGFAFMSGGESSSPPASDNAPVLPTTSTSRSVFDAFSGLGGFFRRPRSKSLDNLGPLPTRITTPPQPVPNSGRKPVERSLERFDQVFGPG
ncbi:trafficking kinesin-binding protein 2-like isoform X2 [Dendronephthya gigantea]|nr:trafficking kinesin-binding protein 2-like isoform X2 [Dendronephthya gigantea]XP_028403054.1 trafficking kinesin-binding protein 2-like isoform X2 [Dendronephthya gigantea]